MAELYLGDAVEWARNYQGEPFHALLADPPYHLTENFKRYSSPEAKPCGYGTDGSFRRLSKGFMGKQWDGGDVAFQPETWEAFLSVMYPGAFGMAFASSRGWHRLACAIEDAGFVIHPSLFGWSYGSGFPKATRVNHGHEKTESFSGHRYGLQALKPALEPIIVFQKPYEGRPIDNITRTGAGVLNVDGGRVGTDALDNKGMSSLGVMHDDDWQPKDISNPVVGRWPANFILLDADAAAALDRQSGESVSKRTMRGDLVDNRGGHYDNADGRRIADSDYERGHNDSGGASRFFFRVSEQLDEADPVRYCAKASRRERDAGLEGMPEKRVPRGSSNNLKQWEAGEREFDDLDEKSKAFAAQIRNTHPTIKPLALTKYLATLLLPPAEYAPRRLFVPFAGVASEVIGAMQAGWDEIVGVELTEEYIPIAEARVKHWQERQMELL